MLEKEPYTSGDIFRASLIQDDVHVEPYFVCKAYAKAAKALGTEILNILLFCMLNVTVKLCPSRRRVVTYGRIMSRLPAGCGAECF